MTDWSLPFSERYFAMQRGIRQAREDIERHQRELVFATTMLEQYERGLAELREREADQAAALEAHCETVRARLREKGWNV